MIWKTNKSFHVQKSWTCFKHIRFGSCGVLCKPGTARLVHSFRLLGWCHSHLQYVALWAMQPMRPVAFLRSARSFGGGISSLFPLFVSTPSKQAISGRKRSNASACEGAEKHENFSAQSQGQKHGLKLRKGDYVVFTDQIVSSGTDFHAVKHTFFHGEIQIVADEIFCLSNSITVSAKMQPAVNGNTCPLCHLWLCSLFID